MQRTGKSDMKKVWCRDRESEKRRQVIPGENGHRKQRGCGTIKNCTRVNTGSSKREKETNLLNHTTP